MRVNGKELKDKRESLGLTQEELAKELDVAINTVSRWEREDRAMPPLLPLAIETVERRLNERRNKK